jgi:hypothetical protein
MRTRRDDQRGDVDPTLFSNKTCRRTRGRTRLRAPGRALPVAAAAGHRSRRTGLDAGILDDHVKITPGTLDGVAHVRLQRDQFADIVQDQATFMSFWAANSLDQPAGNVGHLLDWWLVLRAALDGRPIYVPGSIEFRDRDGGPSISRAASRSADDPPRCRTFSRKPGSCTCERLHRGRDGTRVRRDGCSSAGTTTPTTVIRGGRAPTR